MELIAGAVVAGLVQWLKTQFGTSGYSTLLVLAVVSLVAAGLYTLLSAYGYWDLVYNIIIKAGAIYAFILRRFETSTPSVSSGV